MDWYGEGIASGLCGAVWKRLGQDSEEVLQLDDPNQVEKQTLCHNEAARRRSPTKVTPITSRATKTQNCSIRRWDGIQVTSLDFEYWVNYFISNIYQKNLYQKKISKKLILSIKSILFVYILIFMKKDSPSNY